MLAHKFKGVTLGLLLACSSTHVDAAEVSRREVSKWQSQNCPASASCAVSFGTVPDHHAWLIKYASCYVIIGNVNGQVLYLYLYANNRSNTRVGEINLRPTPLGTASPDRTFNATETAYLRVPAGGTVGVTMSRDTSTTGGIPVLRCSIGYDDIVLE